METQERDPSAGTSEASQDGKSPHDKSPRESIHALRRRLDELAEFARHYLDARLDALKLSARNAALYGLAGVVALIVALSIIVTAAVLVCLGLAGALGSLLGNRPWAGNLLAGAILLAGVALGWLVLFGRMTRRSRERTVRKYAARKQRQRASFGEDIDTPHVD